MLPPGKVHYYYTIDGKQVPNKMEFEGNKTSKLLKNVIELM